MIEKIFQSSRFRVKACKGKDDALFYLKNDSIDLVLLDLILDDDDGKDILSFIRRQDSLTPVIILSSLFDMETRKKCFSLGADDYLVKPYVPEELLMRAERALERKNNSHRKEQLKDQIRIGPLLLNMDEQSLTLGEEFIPLRNKLYELLLLFMQNPNSTIRKETFHSILWKNELYDENSLNVHIHQLRKVLAAVDNPKIRTIPKVGYRMDFSTSVR